MVVAWPKFELTPELKKKIFFFQNVFYINGMCSSLILSFGVKMDKFYEIHC